MAAIAVLCPMCGATLRVKESAAAKAAVRCPECGASVPLHDTDPTPDPDWAADRTETPTRITDESDDRTDAPGGPAAPLKADDLPFLSPPQAADELGRLGPYRVLSVLGKGGMGVVLRAEDPRLHRQVALKAMLPRAAADHPAAAQRFVREARAQAAVEHDHVIPIYQVDEANGTPFIAMPLLKGRTLADALAALGPLPPAAVARIGREAAEGLAAAHARGLIHRDIKPTNLWLEAPKARVKLLDFGLARADADGADDPTITGEGAVVGTPAYMSPEQARGEKLDVRSDLFSLGVVLYQALTGRPPFRARTTTGTLLAVVNDHPPRPIELNPEILPALDYLVMRLLAKDPAARPGSAAEVAAVLTRIEGGAAEPLIEPLSGDTADPWAHLAASDVDHPTVPLNSVADRGRRRRWPPWVVAAVGVVSLTAAGLFVWRLVGARTASTIETAVAHRPAAVPTAKPPAVVGDPAVSDYREAHGLDLVGLKVWAAALPAGFRPSWIGARQGSADPRFDTVAVADGDSAGWRLRTPAWETRTADWKLMSEAGYRSAAGCLYWDNGAGTEVLVWVRSGPGWGSWGGSRPFMEDKLAAGWREGFRPDFLAAAQFPQGLYLTLENRRSGVAWEAKLDLTPDDLGKVVTAYHRKGWHVDQVGVYQNHEPARFLVLASENPAGISWDFQANLSTAEYEAALAERKAGRFRPRSVASYTTEAGVRFAVVWEGYSPK
jgi:serine/threonine protein kinase